MDEKVPKASNQDNLFTFCSKITKQYQEEKWNCLVTSNAKLIKELLLIRYLLKTRDDWKYQQARQENYADN